MGVHRVASDLIENAVRVTVVGCGGTGSAVAAGLPYLHESLLAFGHPFGLEITLVDGDLVSETNCVRQPFTRAEVGHPKSVLLATRLNLFWGLDVDAIHGYVGKAEVPQTDLVIGCVDTRAARAAILKEFEHRAAYWLDFGNDEETGQFVLGELTFEEDRAVADAAALTQQQRLPHVGDLHAELLDPELDEDDGPSCSAAEALTRQAPFVNQVLANHGLALLAQLFRRGEISHHAEYVNLTTGVATSRDVPEPKPSKPKKKRTGKRKAVAT